MERDAVFNAELRFVQRFAVDIHGAGVVIDIDRLPLRCDDALDDGLLQNVRDNDHGALLDVVPEVRDNDLFALYKIRQHRLARDGNNTEQEREHKDDGHKRKDDLLQPFVHGADAFRRGFDVFFHAAFTNFCFYSVLFLYKVKKGQSIAPFTPFAIRFSEPGS